ncbi:TRI12-domain-containing protein [Mytilinidion resinicola]|uniref:TRI12-domain-containing protein n=1 Tax=Mytilinidion resinicola TaxID=574789 RepID=A0A6A6YAP5_9PEZI|nr:TRI12-domain-containing protein [Mytilinidion resinicola]KAF2805892.1 TRI12-domain-containing protein [Mytilinidion resinicola]
MIASGVIFGIGSGFQEMAYACIQEIVPNKWRVYAVGGFELMAITSFLGPLCAFAFISKTALGWRAAYWYMCGFHGFFGIFLALTYFPPSFKTKHRTDGKTKWQLVKELDFVSLFLFSLGCLLFLLGINYGGKQYPWKSGHVIGPIVVGLLSLIALGFWSAYADLKYPLMPRRLFKKVRRFTMVLGVCFCGGMLYYSMNVLGPRQSQLLFTGSDPITKGLYAEQIPLGTIIAGLIVVFICSHLGHERWQLVFFEVCQTALIGSLASIGLDDKIQAICTVVALSSMVTPPQLLSFTMLSLGIDDQVDIGLAVGLASTFRLLGGAVATAIYTAITNNGFASHIASTVTDNVAPIYSFPSSSLPALIKAAALNTAAAYKLVPGINPQVIAAAQSAVKQAYVSAFHTTYLSAIAFGGLAIVSAILTKDTDVRMKTGNRAVQLENEKGRKEEDVEVAETKEVES